MICKEHIKIMKKIVIPKSTFLWYYTGKYYSNITEEETREK